MLQIKKLAYFLQCYLLLVLFIVEIQCIDTKKSPVGKGNLVAAASNDVKIAINNPKPKTITKQNATIPIKCDVEKNCIINGDTQPVCLLDEKEGCIRKYKSECHLKIVGCKAGKHLSDYNNEYCSMDSWLCEEGYERWTIFFGHEKE